jgi:SAM-dependent methyltransferase
MNEGRGMIDRAKNAVKRALLEQWYGYPSGGKASRRSILRKSLLAPFWPDFYAKYYRIIPFVPGGKVLDAGCGNASYLYLLRKMGWDVRGVEMDPGCCRYPKDEYGIEVFNGQLSMPPTLRSFDAVTRCIFSNIRTNLARAGARRAFIEKKRLLVVGVPNAAGIEPVHCAPLARFRCSAHLYGFTPAVLKGMLRREG